MNSTKVCVCGNTVPSETKFCNQCGHKFESVQGEHMASEANVAEDQQCSCGNIESAQAKFCTSCGKPLLKSDVYKV